MTIKLHKDDVNDLGIILFGIINLSDISEVNPYNFYKEFISPDKTKDDGDYKIYEYSYLQIPSEIESLTIFINLIDNYKLKYFSFILNSAVLSDGIIALIVILSIIVVLVVAYFILRKLKIIKKSIFICFK